VTAIVPRRYRLAGLDVLSDFDLLEASASTTQGHPPALVIDHGVLRELPEPEGGNARSADAMRVRIVQPDVGRFVIEDGRRVVVWPEDHASPGAISQLLTGTAFAVALMQRGTLVLHGCVVAIDGRAVAVLGHCGDGKSTTAAACAARGHAVLSDDLVVVDLEGESVRVRPVAPVLRVHDPGALPVAGARTWQATDKTAVGLHPLPDAAPLPLAAIVRLEWGDRMSLTPAKGVGAVLQLLELVYCRPLLPPGRADVAMSQCAAVAARCAVAVLARPRRLDVLDAVVQRLADASSVSA
jgi:hypothetical protein